MSTFLVLRIRKIDTGVAARSNAGATETASVGEELALFEEVVVGSSRRRRFDEWYPDQIPG
jgi:hypothetical protein